MTLQKNDIPAGYVKDHEGRLVPEKLVKPIDKKRDKVVRRLYARALKLQTQLANFREDCMLDMASFIEESAQEYGACVGGKKGNVTLYSFDGEIKVQRSIAEFMTFDERLQVAKELIDQCIHEWAKGSRSEIKALVEHAFQTDKAGKINTNRVLSLKRLNISDEKWLQAMKAITDSVQIVGSKTYVRFYTRKGNGDQYVPVSLDIASALLSTE
jgi:hypothetical protein